MNFKMQFVHKVRMLTYHCGSKNAPNNSSFISAIRVNLFARDPLKTTRRNVQEHNANSVMIYKGRCSASITIITRTRLPMIWIIDFFKNVGYPATFIAQLISYIYTCFKGNIRLESHVTYRLFSSG